MILLLKWAVWFEYLILIRSTSNIAHKVPTIFVDQR